MGVLITTTAATAKPVTLAEARENCRLEDDAHDVQLTRLIDTAAEEIESRASVILCSRSMQYRMQGFTSQVISLPVYPVSAVVSITYDDGDNVEQTLATSEYYAELSDMAPYVKAVDAWPQTYAGKPGSARINITAGYSVVPEGLKQAVLMRIYEHWTGEMNGAAFRLADQFRRYDA